MPMVDGRISCNLLSYTLGYLLIPRPDYPLSPWSVYRTTMDFINRIANSKPVTEVAAIYRSTSINARAALGCFLVTLPSLVIEFYPHNFSIFQYLPTVLGIGVILRIIHLQHQRQQQHQDQSLGIWLSLMKAVVGAACVMVVIHILGTVMALWQSTRDCAIPTEQRLGTETYVSSVLHSDNECTLDLMIAGAAACVGFVFAGAAWYSNQWRRELAMTTTASGDFGVAAAGAKSLDGDEKGDDETVDFDYVQAVKTTEHSVGEYY